MIVIIGGAEKNGSDLIAYLNSQNFNDFVVVLDHKNELNNEYLAGKRYTKKIRYKELGRFIPVSQMHIQFVIVAGEMGLSHAEEIWKECLKWGLPLIVTERAQSQFDELVLSAGPKPFYWSLVHYDDENAALLPKLVLHLMENRQQSAVIDLKDESVRKQLIVV